VQDVSGMMCAKRTTTRRQALQLPFPPSRRTFLGATLAMAAPMAGAQAFPSRPIRMMVGYAAGGGVDAMARMLAQRLPAALAQQVVVENRGGASGMIAADAVGRSPADGYTLLMGESGMLITSYLQPRPGLDPLKSFTPVAGTFIAPLMIVVNNQLPVTTPAELIALLKRNPGKYSYATSGVGTVHHLGFELLKARTDTFIVHIPYRGAAQILPDVISGQVPIGVVSAAAGLAQAKAGRVRAIAMMNTARLSGADNVPAMAAALPGFDVAPRLMLLAPAGTPATVVERLNEAARGVLESAELAQAAAQQGAVPAYMAPGPLAAALVRESADWARIIKAQKISVE
jgi:tripartite-type tricarboxylate transporter receptor subunit TctC